MIQIDMAKLATLLADCGKDLADYPDLAAQVMVTNERLAAAPTFGMEHLQSLLSILPFPKDAE